MYIVFFVVALDTVNMLLQILPDEVCPIFTKQININKYVLPNKKDKNNQQGPNTTGEIMTPPILQF